MDECTVCLDALSDPIKMLECGHSFHTECVDEWLKTSETCPLCREDAPETEEQYIGRIDAAYALSHTPTITVDGLLSALGRHVHDDFNVLHPLDIVYDVAEALDSFWLEQWRLEGHIARLKQGWFNVFIEAGWVQPVTYEPSPDPRSMGEKWVAAGNGQWVLAEGTPWGRTDEGGWERERRR